MYPSRRGGILRYLGRRRWGFRFCPGLCLRFRVRVRVRVRVSRRLYLNSGSTSGNWAKIVVVLAMVVPLVPTLAPAPAPALVSLHGNFLQCDVVNIWYFRTGRRDRPVLLFVG